MNFVLIFAAALLLGTTHAVGVDHAKVALATDTGDDSRVASSIAVSSSNLRGADGGTKIEEVDNEEDGMDDWDELEAATSDTSIFAAALIGTTHDVGVDHAKVALVTDTGDDSSIVSSSANGGTKFEEVDNEEDGMDDWDEQLRDFLKLEAATSDADMTQRDDSWLDSHNSRRKEWHQKYDKSYVALEWSNALAAEAKQWAEHLAKTTQFYHDPTLRHRGENLAMSWGSGEPTTGGVLSRWVEQEVGKSSPANGHLTQVLWRATHSVGCGEASVGSYHFQSCRYYVPGNCGMVNGSTSLSKVFHDSSPCR